MTVNDKPKKPKVTKKAKANRDSSSDYDSSDSKEDYVIINSVKKIEPKPQPAKISPPKKFVSMIGMDPKKAVAIKASIPSTSKASLSSFKIPKKAPDQSSIPSAPKPLPPKKPEPPKVSPKIDTKKNIPG